MLKRYEEEDSLMLLVQSSCLVGYQSAIECFMSLSIGSRY
jgi:hypothetical protein